MPLDEHGFLGRECPSCARTFRVLNEDYEGLPDALRLWCIYCGHHDDHGEFVTAQQKARLSRAMENVAQQMMGGAINQMFGDLAASTRGNRHLRVSYTPQQIRPRPLPGIEEEALIRQRACAACGVRYAVFGEHRFCPVCGPLPAGVIARDAIAAETGRLDAFAGLPEEVKAAFREQGVLDREYVDTIENLVGVVERLAQTFFIDRVPSSASILRGKGNVFQRLEDMADLLRDHLRIDVRADRAADWPVLLRIWAGRHVYTHNDGTVDDRYLKAVPHSSLKLGQRLPVSEADARQAIELVGRLAESILQ